MIKLEGVSKSYGNGAPALSNLDLEVEAGEFVFVVGASGSGKSTFIKLLLKELNPTEGTIYVNEKNISKLRSRAVAKYRRTIGVVFQDFRLLQDRDVYSNIAFAQRVIGVPAKKIRKNAARVLTLVGLSEKYRSNPNELSGGEQQRVALARALVNQPAMLLADEPTGNLDPENSWEIMKLLDKINKQGTTVIVVTHNMDIVKRMNKRVITMKKGVKVSDSKSDVNIKEDAELAETIAERNAAKAMEDGMTDNTDVEFAQEISDSEAVEKSDFEEGKDIVAESNSKEEPEETKVVK